MSEIGEAFVYDIGGNRLRPALVVVPGSRSSQVVIFLAAGESICDLTGESTTTPRLSVSNDLINPVVPEPEVEPAPTPPDPALGELTEADQDKIMRDAINPVGEIIEAAQAVEVPSKSKSKG
jgi:hypothetical protein